jgi:hypothetical protein
MTKNIENRLETGLQALSSDLSRCVGQKGLLQLALDAVLALDAKQLQEARRNSTEFSPQMLLTLLTYCYSASIYGSRDIEWAIQNNRTVRYICARNYPDWQGLRRFRRHHRALLHECLIYVTKQVWALKFDEGETDYVGYEWFELELLDVVNKAALDRLDIAALMDGAESD